MKPVLSLITGTLLAVSGTLAAAGASTGALASPAAPAAMAVHSVHAAAASQHMSLNCEYSSVCAEVADPTSVFGDEYVGHDEPSLLFYSD